MRCRFLRCAATIVAASLVTESGASAQPSRGSSTVGERESTDPFDGIVSPSLYDHMGRPQGSRSSPGLVTAERPVDRSRAGQAWLRLRNRYSTGYRGIDPFAEPEPPAGQRLREPTSSASRRPGAGDAGWFGGTARAFGDRPIPPDGGAAGRGATDLGFGRNRVGGQIAPGQFPGGVPLGTGVRTIPDPTLQPPGQGAFRYGGGPGSAGPFGFDDDVITGSGPEETRVPP